MNCLAREADRGHAGRAAVLALLATLYWAAIAVLMALSLGLILVPLGGAVAFVLIVWAWRDSGSGRPRLSTCLLAVASALYTFCALMIVGIAAYIESHGCALVPQDCGGPNLFALTASTAASLYFLGAWLTAFMGSRSRRQGLGAAVGDIRE